MIAPLLPNDIWLKYCQSENPNAISEWCYSTPLNATMPDAIGLACCWLLPVNLTMPSIIFNYRMQITARKFYNVQRLWNKSTTACKSDHAQCHWIRELQKLLPVNVTMHNAIGSVHCGFVMLSQYYFSRLVIHPTPPFPYPLSTRSTVNWFNLG